MVYTSFKRKHSKLSFDIKTLAYSISLTDLLASQKPYFTRGIFTLSINDPKNTLASHLVPHFRKLCKKLATNGPVMNKVHVYSILKLRDNSTSYCKKLRKSKSSPGRAVRKMLILVPRDWRPFNFRKSHNFCYRKIVNCPTISILAPILTNLS